MNSYEQMALDVLDDNNHDAVGPPDTARAQVYATLELVRATRNVGRKLDAIEDALAGR